MRNPRSHPGRTAAFVLCAAAALTAALPVPAGASDAARSRELWGSVTIVPGREGVLEVTGYAGAAPGAGSRLTLTAPGAARVTAAPLADTGYRGAVAADRASATYTFAGAAPEVRPWQGRTFPFVLSVPASAVPGTRLPGCALRLTDARGTALDEGTCTVTVGLPEPTLHTPLSGVPGGSRPQTAGTAYPGAQVSVRDQDENEVCSTTAGADGTWSCLPGADLPAGPVRLQATATLNGVAATSEQVHITVL
ncbi:Ig-like domain-containing protein [Streptomyces griseosporeus]|uniref:carboxypeptidase regulatory-like domain-containing protein n=1 Tax=Streptomyces griseosporeus TaxID=1910 RepID=UPI0036FB685D